MPNVYRAYGLTVGSDIPIKFLTDAADNAPIDVEVRFRPDQEYIDALTSLSWTQVQAASDRPSPGIKISESEEWFRLLYRRDPNNALEFFVAKDATRVALLKPDAIPENDGITFFIGPICGVLSRLRMKTCLHASVLKVDGRAFALTGDKGAGKSTTAAMLVHSGAELVADDIGVIHEDCGQFWVQPAYPYMRVGPAVIALTGDEIADTSEVLSVGDKRYVACSFPHGDGFPKDALPLDAVYVLFERQAESTKIMIEPLGQSVAIRKLNSNRYGAHMMNDEMRRQDFSRFANFARTRHSRGVTRPNDLSQLANLSEAILQDFRQLND